MAIRVTGLFRYPVKSCRGERLDTAVVEPWGLAGDRRWMLVDDEGAVVTARQHPGLVLVTPSADNSNNTNGNTVLRLRAPDLPDLAVPIPIPVPGTGPGTGMGTGTASAELVPVTVWKSSLVAAQAGGEAAKWFTKITGTPTRLVYLDDPTRRPVNPEFSRDTDRVSFADGYPLLLTSERSLAQLNDWIFEGSHPAEGPVPMTRFRPSVVIDGPEPWAEDKWRALRIGDVGFRVAKLCDRCVFTTIDPGSAVKGKEPLATLARERRWDGKVWFGINLIPDLKPGGPTALHVGDTVEVID
jgi:hypothetical protein